MYIKYLCYDEQDFDQTPCRSQKYLLDGKTFPIVVQIPDADPGFEDPSVSFRAVAFSQDKYVDTDGDPLLYVCDTYIVNLHSHNDSRILFEETKPWRSDVFTIPSEFLHRPYFVVSNGLRCRWYHTEQHARTVVPWAPLITADELYAIGNSFNDVSLENILLQEA